MRAGSSHCRIEPAASTTVTMATASASWSARSSVRRRRRSRRAVERILSRCERSLSHPERIVPDETEPGIVALHRKRYEFALPLCDGKHVLDAGCGVGYGTALLAEAARRVVGVDVTREAIAYARARYAAPNVEFDDGDVQGLERADAEFDVVVSFETIEHVPDPERFVAEMRRVLRPAACSSSRRRAPRTEPRPENPFHEVELAPRRLRAPAPARSTTSSSTASAACRRAATARSSGRRARPAPAPAVPAPRVAARRDGADGGGRQRGDRDRARRPRRGDRARRRLPVRIVHVVIGGEVAGGQVVALQLAARRGRRGDEVAFVSPRRGRSRRAPSRRGSRCTPPTSADVPHRRRAAPRAARARGADVLHTHTLAAANALARLAARSRRAGGLAPPHREPLPPRDRAGAAPARQRDGAPRRALVAVSEDTRRAYERQGYPPARIEVVYNGVAAPPADANGLRDGARRSRRTRRSSPRSGGSAT